LGYYDKKPILHCKCDFLLEAGFMQNFNLGVWLFLVISSGGIMNFASIIHDVKFQHICNSLISLCTIHFNPYFKFLWHQLVMVSSQKLAMHETSIWCYAKFHLLSFWNGEWFLFFLRLKILLYHVIWWNHLKKSRCWKKYVNLNINICVTQSNNVQLIMI
jgi:hypothetical protein